MPLRLPVDPADDAGPQCLRRDQQPLVRLCPAVPGQVVEQRGDVLADRRIGGEQAVVLVDPGRGRVVVAGADVAVPAQRPVRLLAHDQRHLGVRL